MRTAGLVALFATLAWIPAMAAGAAKPIVITKADVAGGAFTRPEAKPSVEPGGAKVTDYLTLLTADKKFETGMYRSGPSHYVFKGKDTYGVDEFMYFIKGGITLTSLDGTVQKIDAGEAVTIPHDWQGTWDSKGYTKFYAIYAPQGNAD